MNTSNEQCDVCYKIICKRCQWEADDRAVAQIQCGKMTACPECGWSPKISSNNLAQNGETLT